MYEIVFRNLTRKDARALLHWHRSNDHQHEYTIVYDYGKGKRARYILKRKPRQK